MILGVQNSTVVHGRAIRGTLPSGWLVESYWHLEGLRTTEGKSFDLRHSVPREYRVHTYWPYHGGSSFLPVRVHIPRDG